MTKYTKEQLENAKMRLEFFLSDCDLTPEELLKEEEENHKRELDFLDSAYNFSKEKKWLLIFLQPNN